MESRLRVKRSPIQIRAQAVLPARLIHTLSNSDDFDLKDLG